MRKAIVFLVIVALVSAFVLAQGQSENKSNKDTDKSDINKTADNKTNAPAVDNKQETDQETENQGDEDRIQVREQVQAKNLEQLREMLQEKKQQMEQEKAELRTKEQKVYQNQNEVRLAVQALHAMENLTGGIGPQVREVARYFDNSIQATIRNEEKVQTRSSFKRFFAGGDHEAAKEMEQLIEQNKEKVQELKQLKDNCECEDAVKEMLQEQIQAMEQEQTRLQELAQNELKKKGLFGWIWK